MLTRRGWMLAAGSSAFFFGGWLFDLVELTVLGVVILALCAGAAAYVSLQPVQVRTERTLHPPRVHAGASSRVDLEVLNTGTRRTPVLHVRDPFDRGWRWARFLVPPLRGKSSTRAAYRLPTEERGIFDIGPLEVSLSDPFGLATSTFTSVGVTQLTVYPRIDEIPPLPTAQGHDPHSGARHPRALLGTGEDFYALRPYEVGDDLRRVHWASTARLDDLMIRQDEMPWQTRSTILLDVRASVHNATSLEIAVSAAASIHAAGHRSDSLVRLVATDGTDSGYGTGHVHGEAILEHLATIETTRENRLAGVAATLRRAGNGGSLAIVTTDRASIADLEALARLRTRYGTIVLVRIERSAYEAGGPVVHPAPLPTVSAQVVVTGRVPFARAWEAAVLPLGMARR
ncbi:MAG TPA: DUF58 domain-containing protein [Acidimicrobiales bacterium]|nr:DUF58 domain-containing protein [Acidimicrobiales bacterium]